MDYAALGPLFESLPQPASAHRDAMKARAARTASATPNTRDWRATLRLPRLVEPRQAQAGAPEFRDGRIRLPEGLVASAWTPAHPAGLAADTGPTRPGAAGGAGLVLDFQVLDPSAMNYTFLADTTYLVQNTVTLYATTTIEGGAVLKYTNTAAARLSCNGDIVCKTGPYRPAIFTAVDDATVGVAITTNSVGTNFTPFRNPRVRSGPTRAPPPTSPRHRTRTTPRLCSGSPPGPARAPT
jgi:hypothetical protein